VRTPRILVLQLKRLGDLILTTPAIRSLRSAYPASQITLVVDSASRDLLPGIQGLDDAWIYNRREPFGFWHKLAFRNFDLCLDFTCNDRSALIAFLSKAQRRFAFSSVGRKYHRAWIYNQLVTSSVRDQHTIDHYLQLAYAAGAPANYREAEVRLPAGLEASARSLRAELGVRNSYFVVHPGTARSEKFWLPERWAEVIQHLMTRLNATPLLTGGDSEGEAKHLRQILGLMRSPEKVVNVAGRIDFLLTSALIRNACFFVGVDTAAAHIASAFRVPQVVLFGPTNPFHWHPRHPLRVVVRASAPEWEQSLSPHEKGAPMSQLSTATVIDAIEAVLGRAASNVA